MNMQLIASTRMAQRQSLPLEAKIQMTKQRIRQWYEHFDGHVYVSFSGGKDSTVLLDLVRSIYPEVPAVFSDTGLEYPEIRDFVKTIDNVTWMKPKRTFRDVVINDGFPLVSKKVAMMVRRLRQPATEKNAKTRTLYLTGMRSDGVYVAGSKIPERWRKLIDAPFGSTESCCDVLKKEPFKRYQRENKLDGMKPMPIVGVMADEGGYRANLTQCNAFDAKEPQSRPMLFWTEVDVWNYIKQNDVSYCSIYDERILENGEVVPGETRTGCMFCAYGAHMEKDETRFQRMAKTHPAQWNYCINKLGMSAALDFIGVKYKPLRKEEQLDFFNLTDHKTGTE